MANTTNNSDEPRKLDDAELDDVTGGKGDWSPWNETAYRRRWAYDNPGCGFEDWLMGRLGADSVKARDAWLVDGSPSNLSYHFDNGKLWTEPYEE